MNGCNTIPEIVKRIAELHKVLNQYNRTDETGKKINDVLIYAEKVPVELLRSAWKLFAKERGVETI